VTLPLPAPLRVAAQARSGLFGTADPTAAGVTEREIRSAVRSGTWVRLRPGLFVTAADLAETKRPDGVMNSTPWP
jgi:hypothetical protein